MIVAGFGFRGAASAASLHDAYARAQQAQGGTPRADLLASAADKTQSAAFVAFARELALPVAPIPPAALRAAPTVTRSPHAEAARQTGSVAEAAALAAAGPRGRLLGTRVISGDRLASCAFAIKET